MTAPHVWGGGHGRPLLIRSCALRTWLGFFFLATMEAGAGYYNCKKTDGICEGVFGGECQGHADDKEISIEEAEASSPHGSAIDSRQIEFDSCPRISGEGRITKKQKDVARDKATFQKRPKHMQDHPMKVGSIVLLMTAKYPNKEIVAYATIISTNPKANVGGVETRKQFYKVRINHPVEKDEPLVRPMPTYNNIGDAHAKGVPIAWPSIFVQMING